MEAIKAFVGHSFAKEDELLVGAILKYLDTVGGLIPNFSWEHAESPQPVAVDDKVLERFRDKNLFIGICTRKEQIVLRATQCWWPRNGHVAVARKDLIWKTSDWIIQEIGFAVGRGMWVILLVEEGVRPPGGIQGTLEYITVRRDAPEGCFSALLAMLATLTPKVVSLGTGSAEATSMPLQSVLPEATPVRKSDDDVSKLDWKVPRSDWSRTDFSLAIIRAIHKGDLEAQKQINERFLASNFAETDEDRQQWMAKCHFWQFMRGKLSALDDLKTIAAKSKSSYVIELLAEAYSDLQEHPAAAAEFERASTYADSNSGKQAELLGKAAVASHRASHGVTRYAEQVRKIASTNPEAEQAAVDAIRNLAALQDQDDVLVGTMERLLAIRPTDLDMRFALAFKYGELQRHELSAYHYLRIPESARSAAAWNNLGATLEELGLPVKSVQAFRAAVDGGETLAASNIALKFLDAGFLPEAMSSLEAAALISDHHKNVDSSLSRAKSAESTEQKQTDEVVAKASRVSDYYRDFGAAAAKSLRSTLTGSWIGPSCMLDVVQDGESFSATGTYPEPQVLGLAMAKPKNLSDRENAGAKLEVSYRGKLSGRAIVGKLSTRKVGGSIAQVVSGLLGDTERTPMLMWLSNDEKQLWIMERPKSGPPSFYGFIRM